MGAVRVFVLLLLLMGISGIKSAFCQSFTQTLGGASAQDGVGSMSIPTGFLVGIRDHDPDLQRHVARSYRLSPGGGLLSTDEQDLAGSVFLQGVANAPNGEAFQFGSVLPSFGNEHQGVLIKFNASGEETWTVLDSTPGGIQFLGATSMADGGAVVCGIANGSPGHNAVVVRYGPGGERIWSRVLVSVTDEEANAVAVDGNDLIVTGRSTTFSGTSDMLFARLDLDGDLIWTTSWGGTANEEAHSIVAQGNGVFVAGGWTTSYGAINPEWNTIPPNAYLIAMDLQGDTLWTRAFGDPLSERQAYAVEKAPNGDLFVAGETGTSGRTDAFLYRLTAAGNMIWERVVDTGKEDRLVHILPLNDGLLGTGRSFGEFGRQLLVIRRNADGF